MHKLFYFTILFDLLWLLLLQKISQPNQLTADSFSALAQRLLQFGCAWNFNSLLCLITFPKSIICGQFKLILILDMENQFQRLLFVQLLCSTLFYRFLARNLQFLFHSVKQNIKIIRFMTVGKQSPRGRGPTPCGSTKILECFSNWTLASEFQTNNDVNTSILRTKKMSNSLRKIEKQVGQNAYANAWQERKRRKNKMEESDESDNWEAEVPKKRLKSWKNKNKVNERIECLMKVEEDADLEAYQILQKSEDTMRNLKRTGNAAKIFGNRATSIGDAMNKNKLVKELMKSKRERLEPNFENRIAIERCNSTLTRSGLTLQSCSSPKSGTALTSSEFSTEEFDKEKKKKAEQDIKVHYFMKRLEKNPFEMVYNCEKRKRTRQAFLNATRKLDINELGKINDSSRPNSGQRSRNSGQRSRNSGQRSRNSKENHHRKLRSQELCEPKEKKNENTIIWEGRDFLKSHLAGKVIQQAARLNQHVLNVRFSTFD